MTQKVFDENNSKIIITPLLMNKLDILSSEYNQEIGGYITGEVKEGVIYMDDILIPTQVVTGGSVDINPGDQVGLYKKFGKKCQKILGHMHTHPGSLGCFWSDRDLVTMKDIMTYKKFYIFIVGSNKKYLIKICTKLPFKAEFDNYDLYIKSTRLDSVRNWIRQIIGKDEELDVSDVEVEDDDEEDDEEDESDKSVQTEFDELEQEETQKEYGGSYIG